MARAREVRRCAWSSAPADLLEYHDAEWGRPLTGERELFERLCLEGFQSGLSWLTVLRKRDAFRRAFARFEPAKVARFGEREVTKLLGDAGIIRSRAKIEAAIGNARALVALHEQGEALSELIWSHAPAKARTPRAMKDVPAVTDESTALAKALKARGFRFVGPTTVYAMMQAVGVVNDHVADCFVREQVARERAAALRARVSSRAVRAWPRLIADHWRAAWPEARTVEHRLRRGPVHELPAGFHVLELGPTPTRAAWIYATCGMSLADDDPAIELYLISPVPAPEKHVELLTIVAHFHRTGERLDLGHTVNIGRPWLPRSRCDHAVISLPYPDGPRVENVRRGQATVAKAYWLLPITGAEREFKRENGLEALERRFDEVQLDYLDARRRSVV